MPKILLIFLLTLTLVRAFDVEALEKYALENIKKKDWIILTSGELVVGEFYNIYSDEVYFKSVRFKEKSIKFKYIKRLKTNRVVSVNFGDGKIHQGYLSIGEDKIVLSNEGKKVEFNKDNFVSVASGADSFFEGWRNEIVFNVDFESGNSENEDYGVILDLKRDISNSKFRLYYIKNLEKSNSIKTSDNQRLNIDYSYYINQKFFYKPLFAEYYEDKFSNIRHSFYLGGGIGYEFYDTSKFELSVFGGPGYKKIVYDTNYIDSNTNNGSFMMLFGTSLEYEIVEDLDFELSYRFELTDEYNGEYIHYLIGKLEHDLYEDLDLEITYIWDRINSPMQRVDGSMPNKDNTQMLIGIGYEF
jgi:putative salt-induced outer membrane protein YdiY